MTIKNRLKKIEKNTAKKRRAVFWLDADGNAPATFDGEQMIQAEAEAKAAALPDNVELVHIVIVYDSPLPPKD